MAEENLTESKTDTPPSFDEDKLAELIKSNVSSEFSQLKDELKSQRTQVDTHLNEPKTEPDFWDNIIDPKVNSKTAKAELQSALAQDKVDFYTGDDWLTVDEWLVEEDEDKRKAEKKALRDKIEEYSSNMAKSNRAMPREDIYKAVLGEKIKKDKVKFEEGIGKRNKAKEQTELDKARRGVDINTTLNDFNSESVHKMSWDKVAENYGALTF
jgi:hypothetical protein